MKRLALAFSPAALYILVCLGLWISPACAAGCYSTTINDSGRTVICTTCCDPWGCYTTCY